MSRAIFTSEGELRHLDQMVLEIEAAVNAMKASDLTVTNEIWQGTVKNNIAQTKQFDLFVPSNTYEEGGKKIKIVSTSPLEGLHSKLKKLISRSVSMEIGMRILDIFLLEHNLLVGAAVQRNPSFGSVDFLQLCQAAVLLDGRVASSPQLEFAQRILSVPLNSPSYRSEGSNGFRFRSWLNIYRQSRFDQSKLESHLMENKLHKQTILDMIQQHATRVRTSRYQRSNLLLALALVRDELDDTSPVSPAELETIRQLRFEQEASN